MKLSEQYSQKIQFISETCGDSELRLILNELWASSVDDYRLLIREFLQEKMNSHFTREQWALLNDLNWRPVAENGYFSVSHCRKLGGVSFSKFKHGFDVEEMSRISVGVLERTCSEAEFKKSLKPEFLWVAKEAALKAYSEDYGYYRSTAPLVVSDFVCADWDSHFENQVFSFRIKSDKTLALHHNKGFIFSESGLLFCLFFA